MQYPPAPWNLQGYAIQTLQWIDIKKARAFVPSELEIISILPGKTLGSVYLSAYKSGSILEYNELIVAAATVRYQGKMGVWISHIYVDNEISVAGGREIWGLPKEIAQFHWEKDSVTVYQNERLLCQLHYQKGLIKLSTGWRQRFQGNAFGKIGSNLLFFQNQFESQIGLIKSQLEIPKSSPFAALNLTQSWLTLNLKQLHLIAGSPKIL